MNQPYAPPSANVTSGEVRKRKVSIATRFLSLCMILGAVVSLVIIGAMYAKILAQPLSLVVFIPFVALFVVYIVKGISLWRGKPKAYKWAFWLFVIQIPILSIPGFSYHLYTGILIAYQYGQVANNVVLNLGGAFNFYISNAIQTTYYGINLFALIAAVYIWRAGRGSAAPEVAKDAALIS